MATWELSAKNCWHVIVDGASSRITREWSGEMASNRRFSLCRELSKGFKVKLDMYREELDGEEEEEAGHLKHKMVGGDCE